GASRKCPRQGIASLSARDRRPGQELTWQRRSSLRGRVRVCQHQPIGPSLPGERPGVGGRAAPVLVGGRLRPVSAGGGGGTDGGPRRARRLQPGGGRGGAAGRGASFARGSVRAG